MMSVNEFFQSFDYNIVATVLGVVVLTFIISKLLKFVLLKLHAYVQGTAEAWDDAILFGFQKPLQALVWVIGGLQIGKMIYQKYPETPHVEIFSIIENVAIIFIVLWVLFAVIRQIENQIYKNTLCKKESEVVMVTTLSKILRVVGVAIGGLIILTKLGIAPNSLIAFGGAGGVIAGLAARDMLSNWFGGLLIFLDRPFTIGDKVRISGGIEGYVEHIGWRMTRMESFNHKNLLCIPNSAIAVGVIENISRTLGEQITTNLSVDYEDIAKMEAMILEMKGYLENHPEIDRQLPVIVNFITINTSSMDILIDVFTKTSKREEFLEIQQGVFLSLLKIIKKYEVQAKSSALNVETPNGEALPKEPDSDEDQES